VMLEAAYDAGPIKKGDLFYYAHMNEESALPIGTKVRAGQQIGVVGDTGEGREATRGKFPPHLHLGWYDTSSAGSRTNLKSGAMNPYPLLLWLERNGGAVTGGTDAAYCEASQGPVPDSSGTSPDLDTGDDKDARPSPVVGESQGGHDRSSNQELIQENGSNQENGPSRARPADATPRSPHAGPAGEAENDETRDGSDEPSKPEQNAAASGADQTTRPSAGDDSLKTRIQTLLLGSSRPDQASPPSNVPVLTDVLHKADKKDDRHGRHPGKPDKKKHKKQKKSPELSERREPEKSKPVTKTGSTPVQPRLLPEKKDAAKTPVSQKDLETSPETTSPEGQKSAARKTP
jgi:hypothetical protein